MSDATRARARAQYYGPEMLGVIDATITRLETEIVSARQMSRAQVTDLLLSFLEPLIDIRNQVTETDDAPER